MKKQKVSEWFDLGGDVLLFLSGLLLLVDFAPRDLFPGQNERLHAVEILRTEQNLFAELPPDVRVQAESPEMKLRKNPTVVAILSEFIKERSPLANTVDWSRVIGVGYATISIPVAQATLAAFQPLYVVLTPLDEMDATLQLAPVGQLEDLSAWLTKWHQSSLTWTAAILLTVGFLLQLSSRCVRWLRSR